MDLLNVCLKVLVKWSAAFGLAATYDSFHHDLCDLCHVLRCERLRVKELKKENKIDTATAIITDNNNSNNYNDDNNNDNNDNNRNSNDK